MDDPNFSTTNPSAYFSGDISSSKDFYLLFISSNGSTLDYTGFSDYSNLDYNIFDVTFNLSYSINDSWTLFGVLNYTDYQDDEAYAYGDLDGKYYAANLGVQFKF